MTAWIIGITVGVIVAVALWLRSIATEILGEEIRAWLPHLSRRKIQRAAKALPPAQRDILEAWEAELNEYIDRPAAMFFVATRIARDRKLVAREAEEIAVESSVAPGRGRARSLRRPTATAGQLVKTVGTVTGWMRNRTARRPRKELQDSEFWSFAYMVIALLTGVISLLLFIGGVSASFTLAVCVATGCLLGVAWRLRGK
jgi:hypothetical protein